MNIYFSCSITGGREDQSIYQIIVDSLLADGHQVPTAHLSRPDVTLLEKIVDPVEVYTRDIAWIENCQAVVAEVSTPSHGVGYEISCALSRGKPVLCLYRHGICVSKMITGNNHPNISIRTYQKKEEVGPLIRDFIAQIDPTIA